MSDQEFHEFTVWFLKTMLVFDGPFEPDFEDMAADLIREYRKAVPANE